jgi:hypothetical protein
MSASSLYEQHIRLPPQVRLSLLFHCTFQPSVKECQIHPYDALIIQQCGKRKLMLNAMYHVRIQTSRALH